MTQISEGEEMLQCKERAGVKAAWRGRALAHSEDGNIGNICQTELIQHQEGRAYNFCSLVGVDVPQAELSALASLPSSMPQRSDFKKAPHKTVLPGSAGKTQQHLN